MTRAATEPSRPSSCSVAASSAAAASLRFSPTCSASTRAASAARSWRGGQLRPAAARPARPRPRPGPSTAASCSASSPSSPSSSPATRVSSAVKARAACSARRGGLLAGRGQPADLGLGRLGAAAQRVRPGRSAGPAPRAGRRRPGPAPASRASSARWASSRSARRGAGLGSARRPGARPRPDSSLLLRRRRPSASRSSSSGSRPVAHLARVVVGVAASAPGRSRRWWRPAPAARPGRTRSPGPRSAAARRARTASSAVDLGVRGPARAPPRARSRRSCSACSSASSDSSASVAWTRSSASSRARASRTSAWMTAALRATSACRPSGLSWRRISPIRSDEPVEVALAGLQLAERLLLALAVLEDAGRLLDEAAAALRGGLQDRVELALADDDVHLPADAGVAEQLLDVQQPGGAGR